MDLPVINHEDYFAKIGDDHKFPINKFSELAKYIIDQKIVKESSREMIKNSPKHLAAIAPAIAVRLGAL